MRPRARLLLCVLSIALGGAIVGIDIGIIATTIGQASFNSYMFPPGTRNASSLLGAIVSMGSTGNVIGSLALGFALERLGRKTSTAVATFFTIVGAVMQAAANGVALMIVGRLLAGVAVGMLNGGLPVYISELATAHERGRLVGLFGLMIAIGFCVANWVGYACSFAKGDVAWRLELAMQIPLALVLLGLTFAIPESPRWLAEKDRTEEFNRTLRRLYGDSDPNLDVTALEIQEQIHLERSERSNTKLGHALLELFSRRYLRRTVIAIVVLQVGILSGSLAIQNYQTLLYGALGFTGSKALLISGCYGFMGIVGQIVNLAGVSDRWPRVRTMYVGCFALAVMLSILAALSAEFAAGHLSAAGARAGVAFIFLYSALYAVFFNSTLFTIAAEMFPSHLRGYGVGFAVMCQGMSGIWMGQITPFAFDAIDWRYYFIFIACLVVLGVVYACFLEETNQVALELVAAKYGDATVSVDDGKVRTTGYGIKDEAE